MSDTIIKQLSQPLRIDQVEFRIQSISAKGFATILAYKDARVDMNRLDEVCGDLWQDKYELINNQLFCSIGVKIGDEWIWRQDVGTESNTEKVKGQASDSFKRAGFRWGIGRELYDYPMIQMSLKPDEFKVENNKGKQTYNLKLRDWVWNAEFENGKIKRLTAVDQNKELRYDSTKNYNGAPKPAQSGQPSKAQTQAQTQVKPKAKLKAKLKMNDELFKKAINSTNIDSLNKASKVYDLTEDQENEILIRVSDLESQLQHA